MRKGMQTLKSLSSQDRVLTRGAAVALLALSSLLLLSRSLPAQTSEARDGAKREPQKAPVQPKGKAA